MKYNIHLNVYDGPLDLLCDLISRQKIDIKDISISEITSQYLAYIDMLNEMDLEVASEFIIMASKLLEIKSRYLLYKQHHEEHEEDPRLELVGQLEEYKKFKEQLGAGVLVKHKKFGDGVVVSMDEERVQILFGEKLRNLDMRMLIQGGFLEVS